MRMKQAGSAIDAATRALSVAIIAALVVCWSALPGWTGEPDASPSDAWQPSQMMKPDELARALSDPKSEPPFVVCVGFSVLYGNGHVAGARFIGPGSAPEGIEALRQETERLPRGRQVVLYCGCCPWKDCPNLRPAFAAMQEMGFKNLRALYLPQNFSQDWVAKGFPVQKSESEK